MGSHRRVGAEQTQGLRTKNGVNEMLASHFLLRDFTEGENLVVAFRLRLLDPTGAVSNAIALHRSVERHGSASYSSVSRFPLASRVFATNTAPLSCWAPPFCVLVMMPCPITRMIPFQVVSGS